MKKWYVLLTILLILLPLVSSQNNESQANQTINNLKEKISESDKIIAKEIEIPERIQPIVKGLFGIEPNMSLAVLIIVLVFWIIVLFSFIEIMTTYSSFSKTTATLIGTGLSIVAGALGIFRRIAIFLINGSEKLNFLENLGVIPYLLLIGLIIGLFFLIRKINKPFKEAREKSKSKETGARIGKALAKTEAMSKAFDEVGKSLE